MPTRSVARREELCISYGPLARRHRDSTLRRRLLEQQYYFSCRCVACVADEKRDNAKPAAQSQRRGVKANAGAGSGRASGPTSPRVAASSGSASQGLAITPAKRAEQPGATKAATAATNGETGAGSGAGTTPTVRTPERSMARSDGGAGTGVPASPLGIGTPTREAIPRGNMAAVVAEVAQCPGQCGSVLRLGESDTQLYCPACGVVSDTLAEVVASELNLAENYRRRAEMLFGTTQGDAAGGSPVSPTSDDKKKVA